ncbi:hypothetical protein O0I10_006738 [Lichtheimia ornata]|uniref:Major facilitator superfamily (MFS) profile domain-containing protein n=1 Tax=Lichtheimia ornata TaxID=688661 RepID=A0AAD7V2R1_9FUNG|nr:uncharacterized protein O0I10_006738 [Lichtheimia ornata]KAJ8657436.1 hypothetical protein O0I10_006738 [Lichtheimia ornata]
MLHEKDVEGNVASTTSTDDHSNKEQALAITTTTMHKKWWQFWKSDSTVDPHSYSTLKKSTILIIISFAGAVNPIASTVYYPALTEVQRAFNTTDTAVNASVSLFVFLTAFCPLVWASWSDGTGRRPIYLVSFAIAIVGSICCAVSVNIAMLIVFRAVSAVGASSVMSLGAGSLADCFEAHERGRAYSFYVVGPIAGPAIGPIIGGYLTERFGWRSTFWFVAIFIFCIWTLILFFLPETYRPDPSTATADVSTKKGKLRIPNPVGALKLLRFPNVLVAVIFLGIMFGVYYLLNTLFAWTYANQYKLDSGTVGLCFLPSAVGGILGGNIGGRLSDIVYNRNVRKAGIGAPTYPEMRLSIPVLCIASFILFGSCVGYGWCVQENVHFGVPMVFLFFVSFGIMLPHVTLTTYLVDCHRSQSASVTACNNLSRYIMAGIGTLLSSDLMRAMGNGILFTVAGALVILLGIPLIYIKKRPEKWIKMRRDHTK